MQGLDTADRCGAPQSVIAVSSPTHVGVSDIRGPLLGFITRAPCYLGRVFRKFPCVFVTARVFAGRVFGKCRRVPARVSISPSGNTSKFQRSRSQSESGWSGRLFPGDDKAQAFPQKLDREVAHV